MKYIANPVTVEAWRIVEVIRRKPQPELVLENGSVFEPDDGMLARMTPEVGDYVVEQEDGYVYLNPKDVFERKYRSLDAEEDFQIDLENGRLSFSDALELLKAGHRVARIGWSGKGMWLSLSPGTPGLPAEKFWSPHNRAFAERNGGRADVLPSIGMKTADDKILMGWLASQTDMLAEDWFVLDDAEERLYPEGRG
jgi:hypothetical protein